MRTKQLLTKTLLVVAVLLAGVSSAWADGIKRVLESQNYETGNCTDWHSNDGTISRATGDATYGAYTYFEWVSGDGGNRSAYKQIAAISGTGYTTKEMSIKGYNVEFDISLKSGNKENKSESQFIVVSTLPYNITANAAYSGTDYLFSLSMGQFSGDGYKTTWYINDLANSTGTTKTLENTKWYHVKLVVTASSVAYTITDNSTSEVVHSSSKAVASMPTMKGFYSLNAYGGAFMKFDNLEIYDFSTLPSMTKSWGQDYRIISKTQLNMEAAEGDATCSNAISAGESFYWIPSLNGTSAATNANVGFYCKNSNGRQWRIANTSSKKCYQGIANVSSSSTVHIYNLKKGQIVKVGGFDDDTSALYAGAGVLTALTDYDNGDIRFYEVNADGTGELTISSTWAYVYFVEVFEPDNEIVGLMDKSSAFTQRSPYYTLKKGETKVFTFTNHGYGTNGSSETKSWYNWTIGAYDGATQKAFTRADFWDDEKDATTGYDQAMSTDGGSSKTWLDWDKFKEDMADATVVATLSYSVDGTYSISAVQTGHVYNYIYYVDHSVSELTADELTIKLGVEYSWSEILSVEQTAVGATLDNSGYATLASAYPLNVASASMTASEGTATAYKAAIDGTVAKFTELSQTIPANTGILLKGTANATVTIPVVASGDAVDGNAFLVNEGGATFDGDDDYYYFAMKKDAATLTFGTFAPGTLAFPANKAYLKVLKTNFTTPAPSLTFDFGEGETTGINTVQGSEFTVNGEYYNLAGQRVAQPTKGLYIVNGKKVVVK